MGILIKAPTRRSDPGLQIAAPATASGDPRGAHCIFAKLCALPACGASNSYMWQRRYGFPHPAARRLRRSRLSARPGCAAQGHQAAAVRRLARRGRRAAGRIGAAVDAGHRGRRTRAACPTKSRPRSRCSASIASASCRTTCPSCWSDRACARFLEQTLIPLNEAVHERVVRGEMQNFQELRFADLAQRLLRDVTRLVRRRRATRGRSCWRHRPTIPISSASRFSSCCCSPRASTA